MYRFPRSALTSCALILIMIATVFGNAVNAERSDDTSQIDDMPDWIEGKIVDYERDSQILYTESSFDSNNKPHILSYLPSNNHFDHSYLEDDHWITKQSELDYYISDVVFRIDDYDNLHICLLGRTISDRSFHMAIYYGSLNGEYWDMKMVTESQSDYWRFNMAVSPSGAPHIVYENDQNQLIHSWLEQGVFKDEVIVDLPKNIYWTDDIILTFDNFGIFCMTYNIHS